MDALERSGWYTGRVSDVELNLLRFEMHEAGTRFLREFGGLSIGALLFCDAYYVNQHHAQRERLAFAGIPSLQPVAASWYWNEGSLWLDASGRAYQADDYELAMVGKTMEEALERLILQQDIPDRYPRWELLSVPSGVASKAG